MKSLYDYLGRAAGKTLGLEVATYAKQQKSPIEIRQISNPVYTGPVNLYTEDLLLSFFNNPNYRKIIKEDEQQYKDKYKNKIQTETKEEDKLPF